MEAKASVFFCKSAVKIDRSFSLISTKSLKGIKMLLIARCFIFNKMDNPAKLGG